MGRFVRFDPAEIAVGLNSSRVPGPVTEIAKAYGTRVGRPVPDRDIG